MNSFDPFWIYMDYDVGSNVTNYPSGDKHVAYGLEGTGGNKNTFNVDDVGYASALHQVLLVWMEGEMTTAHLVVLLEQNKDSVLSNI